MQAADQFDEIASDILLSDAELGLTFVQVARWRPEGARRAGAIHHAEVAYRSICESLVLVRMSQDSLHTLSERLEELKKALAEFRELDNLD